MGNEITTAPMPACGSNQVRFSFNVNHKPQSCVLTIEGYNALYDDDGDPVGGNKVYLTAETSAKTGFRVTPEMMFPMAKALIRNTQSVATIKAFLKMRGSVACVEIYSEDLKDTIIVLRG